MISEHLFQPITKIFACLHLHPVHKMFYISLDT